MNREHAILGASRCVAVSPSDTAPALVALDAEMVIRRGNRERVVPAEEFFLGPGVDIMRMTVLRPGELLTAIRLPITWAGAQFYFEKVRDREVWDFPLVNVASAIVPAANRIERMRLVVGAVAARPWRLAEVEAAVAGLEINEETAELAGRLAIEAAEPLRHNAYKIPLMRNLVKRAIRGATPWTS
jgi:xanthine dehydrogenase YagS FAD-binding subunit